MSSRTFDLSCIGVLTASLVACGGGGGGGNGPSRTLTAVAITGNTTFTSAGQTSQLAARAQYSDSTSDDVTTQATWSSSNQAVATVSSTGLVTSQSGGTSATITATFQSVTGSTGVTVAAPQVQQVSISGNTVFTSRNQTSQLTATATMAGGTTQNVTATAAWAVANTSVASVSSSALLTAGVNGLSEVSATFMGMRGTRTIETRWADCQSNGIRFNAGVGSGAYEALATQGCQSCHRAGSSGGRWDFNRAATDVYNTALLLVRPREAGNSSLAQFGQTVGGHPGAASVNPCYPGSWCGDAIRTWIAGGACPPR